MPMEKNDAALRPHVARSLLCSRVIATTLNWSNNGRCVGVFLPECRQRCRLFSGSRSPGAHSFSSQCSGRPERGAAERRLGVLTCNLCALSPSALMWGHKQRGAKTSSVHKPTCTVFKLARSQVSNFYVWKWTHTILNSMQSQRSQNVRSCCMSLSLSPHVAWLHKTSRKQQ